jgi:hypothetical protein
MSSKEHLDVMDEKSKPISAENDTKHISADAEELGDVTGSDQETLERWNSSATNIFRYLAALFGFIVMGMNDAAYGVSFQTASI